MGLGDIFKYYVYQSDNGNGYVVKLSEHVASAGGFGSPVSPIGQSIWGYGRRGMRHVSGLSGAGKRATCPVASNSNTIFTIGGSFTIGNTSYQIEGAIGEKRAANHIR